MYTYIKIEIPSHYFIIDEELTVGCFNVGDTLEDYNNGKFVLLNEQQVQFHLDNPDASVEEVYNMAINKPSEHEVDELSDLQLLYNYYNHAKMHPCVVNTVNGEEELEITENYTNSVSKTVTAKKTILDTNKCIWYIGGQRLNMTAQEMDVLLSQIYIYYNDCDVAYQDMVNSINKEKIMFDATECEKLFPQRINLNVDKYGA